MGVLNDDYGPGENGVSPALQPYIDTATGIVSRVATCATRKGYTLTSDELEIIERWLSAHFYCCSDKAYLSRSTEGASGAFNGQTGKGFEATLYGQQAMNADWSGCLKNLDKQQRAGASWMGKTAAEQLTWQQRNG